MDFDLPRMWYGAGLSILFTVIISYLTLFGDSESFSKWKHKTRWYVLGVTGLVSAVYGVFLALLLVESIKILGGVLMGSCVFWPIILQVLSVFTEKSAKKNNKITDTSEKD